MLVFGIGVGGCETRVEGGGVDARVTGTKVGVLTPGESGWESGRNARRRADRSTYRAGWSCGLISRAGVNKLCFNKLIAFLASLDPALAQVSI